MMGSSSALVYGHGHDLIISERFALDGIAVIGHQPFRLEMGCVNFPSIRHSPTYQS